MIVSDTSALVVTANGSTKARDLEWFVCPPQLTGVASRQPVVEV